jgi:hypothetical protein
LLSRSVHETHLGVEVCLFFLVGHLVPVLSSVSHPQLDLAIVLLRGHYLTMPCAAWDWCTPGVYGLQHGGLRAPMSQLRRRGKNEMPFSKMGTGLLVRLREGLDESE